MMFHNYTRIKPNSTPSIAIYPSVVKHTSLKILKRVVFNRIIFIFRCTFPPQFWKLGCSQELASARQARYQGATLPAPVGIRWDGSKHKLQWFTKRQISVRCFAFQDQEDTLP